MRTSFNPMASANFSRRPLGKPSRLVDPSRIIQTGRSKVVVGGSSISKKTPPGSRRTPRSV